MKIDYSKYKTILDVGCGQNPLPQATHYCDAYPDKNVSRGADLNTKVIGKKEFKIANLDEGLPYKDKEFDWVHCDNVLEHVKDPIKCCKELMRVSKAGYICCPTNIWEVLFRRGYHKWTVSMEENKLIFTLKTEKNCPPNTFRGDDLFDECTMFKETFKKNVHLFYVKFKWSNSFEVSVIK